MQGCRLGISVAYRRSVGLYADLATALVDGSLPQVTVRLTRVKILIIDDIGLGEITASFAQLLLDVIDRRMRIGPSL